jgi:ketosteroid isomerase-like protein
MRSADEVRSFLQSWSRTTEERDVERHLDLYLRDPLPLVVFSDGQLVGDWLDLRIRLTRDFQRVMIRRVEVHDVVTQDLAPDIVAATFQYDLHVRDVWGVDATARRIATVTFVRTKDGLRIASAHFAERHE